MNEADSTVTEGTPSQIAATVRGLPRRRRYRLVEVREREVWRPDSARGAAATIALAESWIASAPTDPEAINEAEEDLRELKRALNDARAQAGARMLFPEEPNS